ncbi:hypothetical protein IC235_03050 [Hymenobacter sp. BT664]|uniref:VCBS repeat-containing protein n=1 Tax=Hymenobacter montanus TaxID=2771359 RepID=A0A927GHX5_9BACT|nr:hypothetical protein [Hymenobacter montanus]MBD2766868.1 hypothetical protein [Hymenobacter montanus]
MLFFAKKLVMIKAFVIALLSCFAVPVSVHAQVAVRCKLQGQHLHGYVDKENRLLIFLNGSNALISTLELGEDALVRLENGDKDVWRFEDVNFDGYEDVLYRSNSGNVQLFEDVYLYRPKTKSMLLHGTLSAMPCFSVNKAQQQISSTCNHSSAAENWTETYVWSNGVLMKIAQEGTMPATENGDMIVVEYRKVRRNGKWVYIYRKRIG